MKTIFIPAKSRETFDKNILSECSKVLLKNLAILYSVQYENIVKEIKFSLEKDHKITSFCQVLGCSKITFPKQTEAVLLIGSGKFHAISLASTSGLPFYVYEKGKMAKISEKEIESFNQRKKVAYTKFLASQKVGVLISTKPGQQNLTKALDLRKKINKKEIYFFLGDFLSIQEFENFGLNSWINTACKRLDMDSSAIINTEDLNPRN